MTTTRKRYSAKFKARVAVEAIRGEKTLSQLGAQFQVHPVQIAQWRKAALERLQESFVDGRTRKADDGDFDAETLYEQIGRLKMELEWVKKKAGLLGGRSAQLDRTGTSCDQCTAAVCLVGSQPGEPVLRARGREPGECATHAIDRSAIHTSPVLRKPSNDGVVEIPWV